MAILNSINQNPCAQAATAANPNLQQQASNIDLAQASIGAKMEAIAYEFYMNNMLMGPKLHLANATSNMITTIMSPYETFMKAALYRTRIWPSAEPVYLREAFAETAGMANGGMIAMRLLADRLTKWSATNEDLLRARQLPERLAIASKLERNKAALTGEVLGLNGVLGELADITGLVVRSSGATLGFADTMFKVINYHGALAREATNQALFERQGVMDSTFSTSVNDYIQDALDVATGVRPVSGPTDDGARMNAAGIHHAEYQTLTNQPQGAIAKMMINGAKSSALLRWSVPFVRTIANAARYAQERSPFIIPELGQALLSGDQNKSMAMTARMAAGMSIIGAFYAVLGDNLVGKLPTNPDAKALAIKDGYAENTIKTDVGNIPFRNFGPMIEAFLLSLSSYKQLMSNIDSINDPNADEAMKGHAEAFLSATAVAVANMSWFSQVATVGDAFYDLKNGYTDKLLKFVTRMAATATIPKVVTEAAEVMDPGIKDPRGPMQFYLSKLPYLRSLIPNKVDLWGEEMTYDNFKTPEIADPVTGMDPVSEALRKYKVKIPERTRFIYNTPLTQEEFQAAAIYAGKGSEEHGLPSMREAIEATMELAAFQAYENDYRRQIALHDVILAQFNAGKELLFQDERFADDLRERVEAYEAKQEELLK